MSYVWPADVDERPVSVVGGGTLGRRIALILSAGGSRVQLFSRSAGSREAAGRFVDEHVAGVRERFGLAAGPLGTVELFDAREPAVARAWLVVESVSEDLAVKGRCFVTSTATSSPTRSWGRTRRRFPAATCSTP